MKRTARSALFSLLLPLLVASFACDGEGTRHAASDASTPADSSAMNPEPMAAPAAPFRALTPTEYNNTVRDLLSMPLDARRWPRPPAIASRLSPTPRERAGLFGAPARSPAPWPWRFPPESGVDEFEGMVEGQVPSPYSIEELELAASHFGSYVLASPTFFTCDWESVPDDERETCGWASLERFTQRAWRRPIRTDERTRLRAFWEENWAAGSPDEAVVLSVVGVLQTPQFLFLSQVGLVDEQAGSAVPLTHWEVASRLSYFLWDSMPDAALFQAAARGQLATREAVESQARRMLDNPRARDAVVHFHSQWLGIERVHTVSPARRIFGPSFGLPRTIPLDTTGDGVWPQLMGRVRNSMDAETRLFIEGILFDGQGTLTSLLTNNEGYMSDATAPLYGAGVEEREGESVTLTYDAVIFSMGNTQRLTLRPVTLPPTQRAGILTLPSVLAIGAYAVHPAPILRGKRVLERVTCTDLGAPPPGAEDAAPPDTEAADATNRERTVAATSAPVCAACHDILNPPGFAFESFDAMGAWRAEDNGQPVDTSGQFRLFSGESFTFETPIEFVHQLAESRQVRDCYSLRWTRYATGIDLDPSHPGLTGIQDEFRENDDVKSLLTHIAGSDLFRYRGTEVSP